MKMTDSWAISSRERVKYGEQFKSLQPVNGIITGAQAKGFFLQSQLPPLVLGHIWALADTDSDGKMNIDEFSIACKLINLKLRGFELPKTLSQIPTLIASLSAVGGTPTRTPTGGMSPLDPLGGLSRPPIPPQPIIPTQPIMSTPQPAMVPLVSMGAPMIPTQPLIPGAAQPISMGNAFPPMIPQQPIVPMQPYIIAGMAAPIQQQPIQAAKPLITPPGEVAPAILPPGQTPPHSGTPSRAMSISERAPSIESPNIEWAVKGPAKLKYTQVFNTNDKNRTGFLTGVQARGLLMQTKLPNTILAQIWALSDMDADGLLGCDEFVLAMYLCDLALAGETIPPKLPLELIPPAFRKAVTSGSRHGSVSHGTSRHSSVSSQGTPSHGIAADLDPTAGLSQTTFEDKRKENFDKGQAELERRRKTLLDIQRKEQEERERKEREEAEKREKARLEIEMRKQQELERQQQRQREIEQEKEEQRKRELEKKEAARKEMERQRQQEWENQRISDMQSQKQKEQERLLKLKAQNQNFNIELSTLNEKIKELSQKIVDTRTGVTNVKSVIDGMRSTRDTQNSEMALFKSRIKEQNQKLVQLSQEKAKLDAKNKIDPSNQDTVAFSNKQLIITQLRDKLNNTKQHIGEKKTEVETNDQQLNEVKTNLTDLVASCEQLYSEYEVQRNHVLELKNNRKNDSYTSAWGQTETTASDAWPVNAVASPTKTTAAPTQGLSATGSYEKYRALYEFVGRNEDEISFQPGDVIMVPTDLNMEQGWLAGEVNGLSGFFPETYVEKMDNDNNEIESPTQIAETTTTITAAMPIANDNVATNYNGNMEYYMSCYPYESAEIGDLTFNVGEMIIVTKKEGDWWTGTIGTRTGIFPSNYVQKPEDSATAGAAIQSTSMTTTTNTNTTTITATTTESFTEQTQMKSPVSETILNGNNTIISPTEPPISSVQSSHHDSGIHSDDAKNQAEADSEVSQINTQTQINEIVQETYSRPMSTTSTTRGGKKAEIAQVIAPYEPTSKEQLQLQRGQFIMIRKRTDSGWWEGELQAKGQKKRIGWFPATYVKVLQGGRNSGRNTPVSGGRIEMSEQVLDKVIGLYPYKALNDDELSFEKDDIISVLGRDEPEWWRGELNGITGLFPSNYVGPFVTAGNV